MASQARASLPITSGATPSMTADTPRPPNDSLYSLQPTRPSSLVRLRKSKLRWPASACRCSTLAIFMGSLPAAAEDAEDPGVVEGQLAQGVVPSRGAAVAGRHVGLEQQRRVAVVQRAQARHPLGRLPVH